MKRSVPCGCCVVLAFLGAATLVADGALVQARARELLKEDIPERLNAFAHAAKRLTIPERDWWSVSSSTASHGLKKFLQLVAHLMDALKETVCRSFAAADHSARVFRAVAAAIHANFRRWYHYKAAPWMRRCRQSSHTFLTEAWRQFEVETTQFRREVAPAGRSLRADAAREWRDTALPRLRRAGLKLREYGELGRELMRQRLSYGFYDSYGDGYDAEEEDECGDDDWYGEKGYDDSYDDGEEEVEHSDVGSEEEDKTTAAAGTSEGLTERGNEDVLGEACAETSPAGAAAAATATVDNVHGGLGGQTAHLSPQGLSHGSSGAGEDGGAASSRASEVSAGGWLLEGSEQKQRWERTARILRLRKETGNTPPWYWMPDAVGPADVAYVSVQGAEGVVELSEAITARPPSIPTAPASAAATAAAAGEGGGAGSRGCGGAIGTLDGGYCICPAPAPAAPACPASLLSGIAAATAFLTLLVAGTWRRATGGGRGLALTFRAASGGASAFASAASGKRSTAAPAADAAAGTLLSWQPGCCCGKDDDGEGGDKGGDDWWFGSEFKLHGLNGSGDAAAGGGTPAAAAVTAAAAAVAAVADAKWSPSCSEPVLVSPIGSGSVGSCGSGERFEKSWVDVSRDTGGDGCCAPNN